MFEATFIGHQGWLFSSEATRVLVDPLLTPAFGHGGLAGRVFPPRRIDIARFPPIDAVVLTHEHDDHFDLPSLHCIDRSVPVHLSARSSSAAREILRDMGFEVRELHGDEEIRFGDLRYRTFVPDHTGGHHGDEWDVFPFAMLHADGHGGFFSTVDVGLESRFLDDLRRVSSAPGIWCFANNTTDATFQDLERAVPQQDGAYDDTLQLAEVMARRYLDVVERWGAPVAAAACGTGWSYFGEVEWINRWAFPTDSRALCDELHRRWPAQRFMTPTPGTTLTMRGGELESVLPYQPYISTLPPERWPDRSPTRSTHHADYGPACGRRTLSAADRLLLVEDLDDVARHWYATPLFRQLHSLSNASLAGRRPDVCFALRVGDGPERWTLRYDPRRCGFDPSTETDPRGVYASGIECWGSDLLALCRGDIGPSALCYSGRLRTWNADSARLRVSAHLLWTFAHPLRRPQAAASLYRRVLAAVTDTPSVAPDVRIHRGVHRA